jgi:hypothetical protein
MSQKHYTKYFDNAFYVRGIALIERLAKQKNELEQSKNYKLYAKTVNKLAKELKNSTKNPEALISHDSLCVRLERDLYAKTDNERDKCNNQLSENMQIIQQIEFVKNASAYKQTVIAAGIEPTSSPHKDSCITLLDKRIKSLGTDINTTKLAPEIKVLCKVRQANFTAVKNIYKELQKQALFGKEKQPGQAEIQKQPSTTKPTKDAGRER